jgi:outer membrane protein assembly factor BamA
MIRRLVFAGLFLSQIQGQNASFPLESVSLEGTIVSKQVVLEIAGLRIGSPIGQAAIEAACSKLKESGLFESIVYRYAPGPKRGYALTLTVADPKSLSAAAIDLPGIDDKEPWQWLVSQFPAFDRKVPGNDSAQQFLAKKLEEHFSGKLDGQHVVARMEADLASRKTIVSFQPETLPRIASMNFTGQHDMTAGELTSLLEKVVADQGYTDRHFRDAVEMNLRRAYEERGMYRVRFPSIQSQKASASTVTVTTVVEEGPKFTLGGVELVGDNLPVEAMLKAAKFRKGQIANWTEIQQGIWELERPLKRTGYFDAAAKPQRLLHDDQRVLDIRIPFYMGPLYYFGQLHITGLTTDLEPQARKMWKLQPGDPFDYDYPRDFFRAFFASVDSRQFKKFAANMQNAAGDHLKDFTLIFESK